MQLVKKGESMSDIEYIFACLMIPIAYVVVYTAGKADVITLLLEMLTEAAEKYNNDWIVLTDDVESYPEYFESVLIEDIYGYKNIAFCNPEHEWYISNLESRLKILGNVVKWKKLRD